MTILKKCLYDDVLIEIWVFE